MPYAAKAKAQQFTRRKPNLMKKADQLMDLARVLQLSSPGVDQHCSGEEFLALFPAQSISSQPYSTPTTSLIWVHARLKRLLILLENLPDTNISISAILGLLRSHASTKFPTLLIGLSRSRKHTTIQFKEPKFKEFMNGPLHMGFLMKNQKYSSSLRSKREQDIPLFSQWLRQEHEATIQILIRHAVARAHYLVQMYKKAIICCKRMLWEWRPKECLG